jgi:uncharacterized protein YecT (DUF1311 family)
MHISNTYLFVALSLSITSAALADSNPANDDVDSLQGTQLSINLSEGESFRKADAELNRLYKQLVTDSKAYPTTIARLREAQRAWVNFRDKSCIYEAGLPGEGGSIGQMDYAMCMRYHTEKRIEDIKNYLK